MKLMAALFSRPVHIGETNPPGEIEYKGYRRVPFSSGTIAFPPSEQDAAVVVSCVAVIDESGTVVEAITVDGIPQARC